MTIDTERRSYSRVPFNAEVLMQCGHEEWSSNLIDISLKGMLVEPPSGMVIDINKPFAIALFLGEDVGAWVRSRVGTTRHPLGGSLWH